MFKETKTENLNENFITDISKEYMLITAGDKSDYNMMTASWGFVGEMWGADSVAVVVRPSRYTMKHINENEYFSLSFYGDNREIHKICGSKSGRDVNKTALTGLTPVFDNNTVYFDEARLVIVCKKQYVQPMAKEFLIDKSIDKRWYDDDYHNMIIGKIEKILVK